MPQAASIPRNRDRVLDHDSLRHDQFRCLSKTFEILPIALQLLERSDILLICFAPAEPTLHVAFSGV